MVNYDELIEQLRKKSELAAAAKNDALAGEKAELRMRQQVIEDQMSNITGAKEVVNAIRQKTAREAAAAKGLGSSGYLNTKMEELDEITEVEKAEATETGETKKMRIDRQIEDKEAAVHMEIKKLADALERDTNKQLLLKEKQQQKIEADAAKAETKAAKAAADAQKKSTENTAKTAASNQAAAEKAAQARQKEVDKAYANMQQLFKEAVTLNQVYRAFDVLERSMLTESEKRSVARALAAPKLLNHPSASASELYTLYLNQK